MSELNNFKKILIKNYKTGWKHKLWYRYINVVTQKLAILFTVIGTGTDAVFNESYLTLEKVLTPVK